MEEYKLSTKRPDTNKYWTFGNLKEGDPEFKSKWNVGLRVTPELKSLIMAAGDGNWINFGAYPEDKERNTNEEFIKSAEDSEDKSPWD